MVSFSLDPQVASDVQPVVAAPAPTPEVVEEAPVDPTESGARRGFQNEFKLEVIKV